MPVIENMGASSGSRPTGQAPAGLGATRIDPARCRLQRYDSISQRIVDRDGAVVGLVLQLSSGRWFVEIGGARQGRGQSLTPKAAFLNWRDKAIAMEAATADETPKSGSAGTATARAEGIAQKEAP